MATSDSPLLGTNAIAVQARDTGERLQAPATNASLQLADSLRDLEPTVNQAIGSYVDDQRQRQGVKARKDALEAGGAKLADAVRTGKIAPTQNPWYMEAYAKEGAALRARDAFQKLQVESASWSTRNNPKAFHAQWSEAVKGISQQFSGPDESAGFLPVEAQYTSQALASNTAENVQRIQTERVSNVQALAADALVQAAKVNGGTLTGNQAQAALEASRSMWFNTGGDLGTWQKMVVGAVTSAAQQTTNGHLVGVLNGLGLGAGEAHPDGDHPFGDGAADSTVPPPNTQLTPLPQQPSSVATILTPALEHQESRGKQGAVSPKGAVGVRQLLPDTARQWAREMGEPGLAALAMQNTAEGADANRRISDYGLKKLSDQFGGNPIAILSAYNAGPNRRWITPTMTAADIPAKFQETRDYVAKIMANSGAPSVSQSLAAPADTPPVAEQNAFSPSAPSLASLPGVAEQMSQTSYYIARQSRQAALDRLQDMRAKVEVDGSNAEQEIYKQFGTGVFASGDQGYVGFLQQRGYTGQAIAYALNKIQAAKADQRGLSQLGRAAKMADPETQSQIYQLGLEAHTEPRDDFATRVGQKVHDGTLTGAEGENLIASAISTGRYAARQGARLTVHSYSDLRAAAQGAAKDTLQGIAEVFPSYGLHTEDIDPTFQARIAKAVGDEQAGWLSQHPGDWVGAKAAGDAFLQRYAQKLAGNLKRGLTRQGIEMETLGSRGRQAKGIPNAK